ncbi:MAG: hypothetical protein ABFD07_14045, partial [Methanobacterium sp.]
MKCKNCEINEGVKYSKYATGDFCSKKCAKSYSTKNSKNQTKIVQCHGCGNDMLVNKRAGICYCDDCKFNNKKKDSKLRIEKVKKCLLCGIEIEKNKKYCNDCINTNNKNKLKE